MKKIIFVFLLIISTIAFIGGCEMAPYDAPKRQEGIRSIHLDQSTMKPKYDIETFKLSDLKLVINYFDEDGKTVEVKENMLSSEDLASLDSVGEKNITINYEGFALDATITLAKKVKVTFYNGDNLIYQTTILQGDNLTHIPQVPRKAGMIGRWNQTTFTNILDDLDVYAEYTVDPDDAIFEVIAILDNIFKDEIVDHDLTLPNLIGGVLVTYESNNPNFKINGEIKRDYEETDVEVNCEIMYEETIFNKVYAFKIAGYKDLTNGIASGYLYRNYGLLKEEFFDTLDIVYCAFIEIDTDGDFIGLDATGKSIESNNRTVKAKINDFVMPAAKEKGIYIVPSLGGGGSSASSTFKIISSSSELRRKFAENIVKLINENGYDGIDIDWETPGTTYSKDFTLMMEEIYTAVKANNPHHLVTAAIGGGKWQPPYYDLTNSAKYLDYINVMCYGMTSNTGYYQNALYPHTSYNDPTNKVGKTLNSCSIKESVTIYNNLGVPNSKLIFGAAWYGIKQTKKDGSWTNGGSIFFDSILSLIESGNYDYYFDEVAKVPYLLSKDRLTFVSYDDERSIIEKCHYVLENGCAGIMYWENGCDTSNTLVHALNIGLNKDPSYFDDIS